LYYLSVMIYLIGGFVVLIGLIQLYRLYRNSKRPKIEGKIIKLMDQHLKQDKNKKFRTQPHAKVTFELNKKHHKVDVLFKDKEKQIGDTVQLSYFNNNPESVEMYVPKAEFTMAFVITLIGIVILIISYFIMQMF